MSVHSIQVVNKLQAFDCKAGMTLLAGMELQLASLIRVGCRRGGCGLCKIRVLQGEYAAKKMSRAHVTPEEQELGYVLACRVVPASDMVIESDHGMLSGSDSDKGVQPSQQ